MLLAALITFVLAACVTGMIGLGAAITYKGFRGRLIDAHCHCGRCGYDLTGHRHQTDRCPECGSKLGLPGMVRRSVRQPQKRLISLGLALIIFNVGGLTACWKIGEMRSAKASRATAPSLGTATRTVITMPRTDQWAYLDAGPDDEVVSGKSSAQTSDLAHQSARSELQFVDSMIQLPPLRRESIRPATSAMWGFDRRDWWAIPEVSAERMRILAPALSGNAVHLQPGFLRSSLRPIDLVDQGFETSPDVPPIDLSMFGSTQPVSDNTGKLGGQFSDR